MILIALANEWHPTKNGNLTLDSFAPASHKNVWWICNKGHEWQARIENRTYNQSGCPYCANKKANIDNCLQTKNPELAKEWHPTKNGELTPLDFVWKSEKEVWWKCENGHEWRARISYRNRHGSCRGCKLLSFKNPELAKQWHPTLNDLTPDQVSMGSNRRVWWRCKNGHEWCVPVYSRAIDGDGCRKCYAECQGEMRRKLSVRKAGSITDTNPELAKQWHPTKNSFSPDQLSKGSKIPIWWVCKKGHEWKAQPSSRTRKSVLTEEGHVREGIGCPWCCNKGLHKRRESLHAFLKTRPDLVSQWHPTKNTIDTRNVSCGSNKKVWWKCKKGHEWQGAIVDRATNKRARGCPSCNSKSGKLELRIYSELLALFDLKHRVKIGKKRDEVDVYITKYKIGIEIDGYQHKSKHKRDVLKHKRIEEYGIKLIHIRDESLEAITERDIFYNENYDYLPILLKLINVISLISKLDNKDSRNLSSYITKNRYVNEKKYFKLIAEKSIPVTPISFLDKFGDVAKEYWDYKKNEPLKPEYFTVRSGMAVWWKCRNGHEWKQKLHEVSRNAKISSQICKYCSGHRLYSGNNSLDIIHPELMDEWDFDKNKIKPEQITAISSEKVWWKCKKGHEWKQFVYYRTKGVVFIAKGPKKKTGCPKCAAINRGLERRLKEAKEKPLSVKFPKITKQWHPTLNDLTPDQVSEGSSYKAWWKCDNGHEWQTRVHYRTRQKSNCPKCWYEIDLAKTLRKAKVKKAGSVADTHPWLAYEWHPTKNGKLTPYMISHGSAEKIWWICEKNHDYKMTLNHRTNRKENGKISPQGCPTCALRIQGQKYVQHMIKKKRFIERNFP
jgi:very-short-patch-repair endonuclease